MIITVDTGRCQGHGRCNALCPEVFDVDDEGYVLLVTSTPAREHEGRVREAAANCPEQAITAS